MTADREPDPTLAQLATALEWTVELAGDTPADLAIPTCPGWDAAALWKHLGMVHRWAAEMVATRSPERIDRSAMDMHLPEGDAWAPWLADGADILLAALADAPLEAEVWVWGADPHVRWWVRRQLHETVIHNVDAALALGESVDLDPELASDGLDELLDNVNARLDWRGDRPMPEGTVHLHATDADLGPRGEWMVTFGAEGLAYTHEHGKGDVAVRAPMTGLLLAAYGRMDLDGVGAECFGDRSAWDSFRDVVQLG